MNHVASTKLQSILDDGMSEKCICERFMCARASVEENVSDSLTMKSMTKFVEGV